MRFLIPLFVFIMGTNGYCQTTTFHIKFKSAVENVSILPATLRYNKEFAYSFTFDDGKKDAFTNAYPLFSGGIAEDNVEYQGLYYTDGCGNSIPFKAGIAWTSLNPLGQDPHDFNPDLLSWNNLLFLHNKGWRIMNHSLCHQTGEGTDYDTQVSQNIKYVKEKTGIELKEFVIPSGDTSYIPFALKHGMTAIYNQTKFPGVNGLNLDGKLNLKDFRLFRRFLSDEDYTKSTIAQNFDLVAQKSSSTNHYWYSEFTHHISIEPEGGSLLFSTFKDYMNDIESNYGKNGKDNIWVASLQEVYEYLTIREQCKIAWHIQGDEMSIELDFSNIPNNLDTYALSLIVNSNQDIASITLDDAHGKVNFSNSGSQKLINLEYATKPTAVLAISPISIKKETALLYPNPVDNYLFINTINLSKLKILDVNGKVLFSKELQIDEKQDVYKLELPSNLNNGSYLLQRETPSGKTIHELFIKQ